MDNVMRYTVKRQMRQSRKSCPNYQDLFSLEDIFLAHRVRKTHNPSLSRIVVCADDQRYNIHASIYKDAASSTIHCYTLKVKYALEVWAKAVLVSSKNPSDILYYWWLKWVDNDTSFRHLEYNNFYRNITVEELLSGFWRLLKDIANSGEITVKEGLHIYTVPSEFSWEAYPIVHCDLVVNEKSGRDVYDKVAGKWPDVKEIGNYQFDDTPINYKWDDIKDMFIELTLDQLRLVQMEKMHKCHSIDHILFDACDRLDIEGVKRAIELGANVNALNDRGQSPITETIEFAIYNNLDMDKKYSDEEYQEAKGKTLSQVLPILQLLIDHGADVDLFGYEGKQSLLAAYYAGNVEVTEFLLKMGSNPNYNSYLDDITSEKERACVCSSVMNSLYDEIDDYTPEQEAIEKLMYQYGARNSNWGYDYNGWEYIGKYIVKLEPSRNDGPFFSNTYETIGDDKSLVVEREDGELEVIDLTGVDGLTEWVEQYHQHYNDMTYDWNSWRDRGLNIANKIAELLPNYVSLRCLYDSKVLFHQPYDKSCMYYNHGVIQ